MSDDHSERPEAQANAGAFLAPFGGVVPAPMRPQDAIDEAPTDPDDPGSLPAQPAHRSTLDILLGRKVPPPKDR